MITIIDYNAGNIRSVLRACAEVGAAAVITGDPSRVAAAEKIIFQVVPTLHNSAPELAPALALSCQYGVDRKRGRRVLPGWPPGFDARAPLPSRVR